MRLKTLTFDWNCVIAVESAEAQGNSVNCLVQLHRRGLVDIALTTVSASESLRGSQEFPASASKFRDRISSLGWDDIPLLLGPEVIGLTYIGMCKIVGDSFAEESNKLWEVLAPNVERVLPEDLSDKEFKSNKFRGWRNAWCDVHTLWTHIDSDRDMFVTLNTRDFQTNLENLEALGLREVATPEKALASISSGKPQDTQD